MTFEEMKFEGIPFPRALLAAQERGELAVFAGAGVSMPAPSSLPDFNSLANELANGTAVLQPDEAADRFLGKLPENLNIHERTRERLSRLASRPNSLHKDLLRIFTDRLSVRLVTTNFDDHFATSSPEVFSGGAPEMFFAPALPVGSDFTGIVHLHGSVRQPPNRIVLTDRDFGKAYLTEGWARRFVLELFLKYTVLFVGYSHNDPVMQYLARGLPPGDASRRRFALSLDDSRASWDNLGVRLLPYFKRKEVNEHIQLQMACKKWADRVRATPLEMRDQIRKIVEKPPQPTGEEIGLIERALEDSVLVRFFAEFALSAAWLRWVSGREAFRRILSNYSNTTECDRELTFWFAGRFAVDHASLSLDLIRRNGSYIPPHLWSAIALNLRRSMKVTGSAKVLQKWIPILLRNESSGGRDYLEYIFAECQLPQDDTTALLLFQHLLRPTVSLSEGYGDNPTGQDDDPKLRVNIVATGSSTFVAQGWQHFKDVGLGPYADHLLRMSALYLEEASSIFRLYDLEFPGWDPISSGLPALDTPSLDLSRKGLNTLVDVARETLKWIVKHSADHGLAIIRSWSVAKSLTLRRLAMYGAALTDGWSANDKLAWLTNGPGFFVAGLGSEILGMLHVAFPQASPDSRDAVIREIARGQGLRVQDKRDRIVWALLISLDGLVPNDPLTQGLIQEIEERRPEFAPTGHVENGLLGLSPSASQLPFSAETLLACPPSETIEVLLSFQRQEENGPDRKDARRIIREAITERPSWGFDLSELLCSRTNFDSDLWPSIITALGSTSAPEYSRIIRILSDHPAISMKAAEEVIRLLEEATSRETNGIDIADVSRALHVGLSAWESLNLREWRKKEAKEWLTVAINDSAGIFMQAFIRCLGRMRQQAGEGWIGIPPVWKAFLSTLVKGESWSDAMARVVLAGQVQVLFWLDSGWSTSELLAIFNWSANRLRAEQAWHGYLVWGRWSDEFLNCFLPRYIETFHHLDEIGEHREQFYQHLAAIAIFSSINPREDGWLKQFLIVGKEQDRKGWTDAIPGMLDQVPREQRQAIWERWMRDYWADRVMGIPMLLSGEEAMSLAEWPLHLPDAFGEAVDLMLRSPTPITKTDSLFTFRLMHLEESSVGLEQPTRLAQMILHILRAATALVSADPVRALMIRLLPTDAQRSILFDICERLASLGLSADAAELKQRIIDNDKSN